MTNTKYRNYTEQVQDVVNWDTMEVLDSDQEPEFFGESYYPELAEAIYDALTEAEYQEALKEVDGDEEELSEWVYNSMESVYVIYKVELTVPASDPRVSNLEILWNDELQTYLMPVYAYGMSWDLLAPMHQE